MCSYDAFQTVDISSLQTTAVTQPLQSTTSSSLWYYITPSSSHTLPRVSPPPGYLERDPRPPYSAIATASSPVAARPSEDDRQRRPGPADSNYVVGGVLTSAEHGPPSPPADSAAKAGLLEAAVPMNIGLIAGVAVAIAVLLCMLVYVVIKWAIPQSAAAAVVSASAGSGTANGGGDKSALRADFDPFVNCTRSPPDYYSGGAAGDGGGGLDDKTNGTAPAVTIFMGGGGTENGGNDATVKSRDVKEWFV